MSDARRTAVARTIIVLALLLTASSVMAQQPAPSQPDTSAITPAKVDLGRAIFHGKGMCFACHGPQLEGSQIAPTLKAHAWRDAKHGEFPAIFYVATHGVRGTLMVAFPGGISQAEALSVASYVWSVSRGKVKP
jgi:mono/diheme cytochrome c family protein